MESTVNFRHIGKICTPFKEKFGIPRQSGKTAAKGEITFFPEFNDPNAVRGLNKFSHLWILFDFSLAHTEKFEPTVRPPRLGGNERVGVFATRSPFRPNPVGLSSVKIENVSVRDGKVKITVSGVDLLDGTPIFDIKPYLPYSDAHTDATGGFTDEKKERRLTVRDGGILDGISDYERTVIKECIAQDPRPSYQNDEERVYGVKIFDFDVKFKVKDSVATITSI
ncbi:MAG: tRNA (N6-threonylcarbamoyladenosine(37)-N6)-methyltransferase TrmO [Clostridia bacterium]|nr:tRNA (N6-threonylcarbamoyladenosine(37)-N6)-methyltransferase TrmO [Clostridia bacterium]